MNKAVCPTGSPGYHLLGNKCIYYEKTYLSWENAKKGCKDKFSSGGRLHEPVSLQEHSDVHTITNKSSYWIGVDDLSQEGNFTYSSSGSKISFNLPWHSGYGRKGSSTNCVLTNNGSRGLWLDWPCTSAYPSVCESE